MTAINIRTVTRPDHDRLYPLALAWARLSGSGRHRLVEALDDAQIVAPLTVPRGVVTMNATVSYRDDETQRERTVTLAYPGEEDIGSGRVSVFTPIGQALIGRAEGQSADWVTLDGKRKTLTVLRVIYQPEADRSVVF